VDAPLPVKPRYPLEFEPTEKVKSELIELEIPSDAAVVGKQILELGLPNGTLVVLISRNGEFIVPGGATILEAGDTMLVLADKASLDKVHSIVRTVPTKGE
jgi:cell volume regulation protein A